MARKEEPTDVTPPVEGRIQIEVASPDGLVLRDIVDEVTLPGLLGEAGILPGHRPFLLALRPGPMRIRRGQAEDLYAVAGGFAEVNEDRLVVLADAAEHAAAIDLARAERARERAEAELREALRHDQADYQKAEAALQRALARISVATAWAGSQPARR